MTLDSIIRNLQKSGSNTKKLVCESINNASVEDLMELRQSINEKICYLKLHLKEKQIKSKGENHE